jgi:hypothetical protein
MLVIYKYHVVRSGTNMRKYNFHIRTVYIMHNLLVLFTLRGKYIYRAGYIIQMGVNQKYIQKLVERGLGKQPIRRVSRDGSIILKWVLRKLVEVLQN